MTPANSEDGEKSLYAVGRGVRDKVRAARVSGAFLIALGAGLLIEVICRFVAGADPIGAAIIIMAAANTATNLISLRLLRRHRQSGVHLKASWIFTSKRHDCERRYRAFRYRSMGLRVANSRPT